MERDEIQRILRLVQEGKLDAKEALDLIESIEKNTKHTDSGDQKPDLDQLRGMVDRLAKTLKSSETWKQVEEQFRISSQKGVESLKSIANQIQKQANAWNLFGSTIKKELELPLDISENKTLKIDHKIGKIKIKGNAPVSSIKISATLEGKDEDETTQKAETFTPVIEENENILWVKMPDLPGLIADLEIELSAHCSLDIKLGQGNVKISQFKGDMELHVSRGNINIKECGSQNVHIESALGNSTLDLLKPFKGLCKLHIVQGSVECKLPESSQCKLDLKVVTGVIHCNLPLEQVREESSYLRGQIGDGSGKLEIHVVTGNIEVEPASEK